MPFNVGEQKGVLTTSATRAGSQKLTPAPMRRNTGAGAGHVHNSGGEESVLSICPPTGILIGPIFIGNIHSQQISVMGFGKLPSHTALEAAVGSSDKQSTLEKRNFFNI